MNFKFRVWDKQRKVYVQNAEDYYIDSNGLLWVENRLEIPPCLQCLQWTKNNLVVEVFTGIKDKHDKEIYEGDILKYNSWYNGRNGCIDLVEWEAGAFYIDLDVGLYLCGAEKFEIIGNARENPELLEER